MDGASSQSPAAEIPLDERDVPGLTNALDEASRIGERGLGHPLNLMAQLYYEYGSDPWRISSDIRREDAAPSQHDLKP
ncbi:MAG: hypothetical protein LUG84_05990 [Akkermansiaceae bacterium]|nr:hypothetical protein [Akkermansia sp.]MCD7798942.1 hypothetical protein [Akkermansiaceae bacterium]MCD8070288.1 hypothetical protein [Akkermansiaceae bacterium]